MNGDDRKEVQQEIDAAANVLDVNLQALVKRTQRMFRITLAVHCISLVVLALISGFLLFKQASLASDTDKKIAAAQRDYCPILYTLGTPTMFRSATRQNVLSFEEDRQLYVKRGCQPALPPPSPAFRQEAAKFGIKLVRLQ